MAKRGTNSGNSAPESVDTTFGELRTGDRFADARLGDVRVSGPPRVYDSNTSVPVRVVGTGRRDFAHGRTADPVSVQRHGPAGQAVAKVTAGVRNGVDSVRQVAGVTVDAAAPHVQRAATTVGRTAKALYDAQRKSGAGRTLT